MILNILSLVTATFACAFMLFTQGCSSQNITTNDLEAMQAIGIDTEGYEKHYSAVYDATNLLQVGNNTYLVDFDYMLIMTDLATYMQQDSPGYFAPIAVIEDRDNKKAPLHVALLKNMNIDAHLSSHFNNTNCDPYFIALAPDRDHRRMTVTINKNDKEFKKRYIRNFHNTQIDTQASQA